MDDQALGQGGGSLLGRAHTPGRTLTAWRTVRVWGPRSGCEALVVVVRRWCLWSVRVCRRVPRGGLQRDAAAALGNRTYREQGGSLVIW